MSVHEFPERMDINPGDGIEYVDQYLGRSSVICKGTVTELTKCFIKITNEHGNKCRCHISGKAIGHSYPDYRYWRKIS